MRTRLLAVAALALAACGSTSSSPSTSSSGTPFATATIGDAAGETAVDRCMVGTWVSTAVATHFAETGAEVTLTGGAGLKLTFAPGGEETADWSSMAPLATSIPVNILQSYRGTSRYRVHAAGGTLAFLSADYSGWSGQQTQAGQTTNLVGPDPIPAEAYTCSLTTLTESNTSWQATFTRR